MHAQLHTGGMVPWYWYILFCGKNSTVTFTKMLINITYIMINWGLASVSVGGLSIGSVSYAKL